MPTSLKEILKDSPFFDSLRILSLWEKALGPHIIQNATPLKFQAGVLTVGASSSAWANQLRLLGAEIRKKLNAALGQEAVKEIKFVVDQEAGRALVEQPEKTDFAARTRQREEKEQKTTSLLRLLRQTPWITYQQAAGEISTLGKEEFQKYQRRLRGEKLDELWKAAREIAKKQMKEVSKFKDLLYDYVMLKTGKPPAELTLPLIRKTLGPRLWEKIKEKVKE